MTKKKKKDIGTQIAEICLVIFAICFIIFLAIILPNLTKPQFTITKEECWNKININFTACYQGCWRMLSSQDEYATMKWYGENITILSGFLGECRDLCIKQFGDKEIQKCEQVGVDKNEEIFVDKYKEEGNATWGILAKNINERWLDENCKCLEINCSYIFKSSKTFESPEKFVSATYEGMIWYIKDKKGNDIAALYCPQGENCFEKECTPCSKYKCEDYFVEIK